MRSRAYGRFLLLSMAGAFICAVTYIGVSGGVVPGPEVLLDPFVLTIAVPVAAVGGLLVSPFVYRMLRDRRIPVAFAIVLGSTIATIVVVTPVFGLLGIPAAVAAVIGSSALCARLRVTDPH